MLDALLIGTMLFLGLTVLALYVGVMVLILQALWNFVRDFFL